MPKAKPRAATASRAGKTSRAGKAASHQDEIGRRLRVERERLGLSLREVARRLELTPSALSQIETGRSRPSVSTLYAIVSELGVSLDELFSAEPADDEPRAGGASAVRARGQRDDGSAHTSRLKSPGPRRRGKGKAAAATEPAPPAGAHGPVQPAGSRAALELESGVLWERLTSSPDPDVDFLYLTYEVGGASSSGDSFVRHCGTEYGIVLSGRLSVSVGFDKYELGPGDSVSFASTTPHRLANDGDEPVEAVWFVVGRRSERPLVQESGRPELEINRSIDESSKLPKPLR